MTAGDGRAPLEPGSREPSPAVSALTGFDPSRSKLETAVEQGKQEGKLALFFGADPIGQYLHDPNGRKLWDAQRTVANFPWSDVLLDTGLLRNGKRADVYDGRVYWTCGGLSFWYAFFWWDRSGDSRGASNSGFYVRGFGWPETTAAFAYACEQFPRIVARQKHLLILQAPRDRDASLAEDAERLSPEGVAARAEGIAQDHSS